MPATDPAKKPIKKHPGRWWRWPLYALLVLAVAFGIFRYTVHRRVVNRINAIRDAGYPVTLEELDAWYEYPDGPNAADVYQKAFDAYVRDEAIEQTLPIFNPDIKLPLPGEPLPKDMAQRIEAYLADNAKAISLLEEAAKIEGCRYPIDMTDGFFVTSPAWSNLRHSAKLLVLQSILDVEQGSYDLAADRCMTILLSARSLKNEPITIAAMVSISIQSMAFDQIDRLINTNPISTSQLHSLDRAIKTNDPNHSLLRGMVGERCIGLYIFAHPADAMKIRKPSGLLQLTLWNASGAMDIDHGFYLRYMQACIDLVETPTQPLPDVINEFDDLPRWYLISQVITPDPGLYLRSMNRINAHRSVVLTGIAVEQFRRANSELPNNLEAMIPMHLDAIPIDPYTQQPIKYRTEGDGAIIYSIGVDGTDDGGRKLDDNGERYKDGTDITFTFGGLQEKLWPREVDEEVE